MGSKFNLIELDGKKHIEFIPDNNTSCTTINICELLFKGKIEPVTTFKRLKEFSKVSGFVGTIPKQKNDTYFVLCESKTFKGINKWIKGQNLHKGN